MHRYENNPIITPEDVKPSMPGFEVVGVFNAGAIFVDGKTCLLLRIAERPEIKDPDSNFIEVPYYNEEKQQVDILYINKELPEVDLSDPRFVLDGHNFYLTSISHLRRAWSEDGVNFIVESDPALFPSNKYESFGIEDPRITELDGKFYVNYTAVSKYGAGTALAVSKDMKSFERKGFIFAPDDRNVAIFPEKINGRYYALHRPHVEGMGKPSIWLASSDNLLDWGSHECLMLPRQGLWDGVKIGAGAVPIRTASGWLLIYHGADEDDTYSLGLALLDLEDPSKVLARSKDPILVPQEDYERNGFYGDVVFTDGVVVHEDGAVNLYYAASDEKICLMRTNLEELCSVFNLTYS